MTDCVNCCDNRSCVSKGCSLGLICFVVLFVLMAAIS